MTTTRLAVPLLSGVALLCGVVRAEPLVLAESGSTAYRIVVAEDASAPVRRAADELRRFLREITGVAMPVVTDAEPAADCEILVGHSGRLASLGKRVR